MTSILLVQGANMAHLGRREPEIHGVTTTAELDQMLQRRGRERGCELEIYHTHTEGEAIDRIYRAADERVDGLLMNPAGFIHAGYALRDCLRSMRFPYVEVHISNVHGREDFRHVSLLADRAVGTLVGLGTAGYRYALDFAANHTVAPAGGAAQR